MAGDPLRTTSMLLGPALGFVAGFADAASFVGADGIFCAHVTGNFVVLAADIARHAHASEWLKLATFPVFVASVMVASRFYRRIAPGPSAVAARALLAVNAAAFAAVTGVALVAPPATSIVGKIAIVVLLVVAMGSQNTIHRLTPTVGSMTTVMTGNVTQWVVELLSPDPDNAKRHRALGNVIAAFAIGCLAGALGVRTLGFAVTIVPLVVTLVARAQLRQNL